LTAIALWHSPGAPAQELEGRALVEALRGGGYTIVMRHARSPREQPEASVAAPGNENRERQLDATGLATAAEMGEALKVLDIPIGEVLSSPTFRAMQTAEALDVGDAEPVAELGDGGRDMQPDTRGDYSERLRMRASEPTAEGTNRIMITHSPNLAGAFESEAEGMMDGEALVISPHAGEPVVVARIAIEGWPELGGF
jgi:phosphohistidine phosphatase SixA